MDEAFHGRGFNEELLRHMVQSAARIQGPDKRKVLNTMYNELMKEINSQRTPKNPNPIPKAGGLPSLAKLDRIVKKCESAFVARIDELIGGEQNRREFITTFLYSE